MTLLQHVYALRNLLSRGPASDDTSYSLRLIAHFLKVARGILTEQKANKYHHISEQTYQSLCLDLVESDFHNCCSGPATNCKLLRSSSKLPRFMSTRWGDLAKVTTLDGRVLSKTSMTSNRFAAYSLTNTIPKAGWFISDGYLYIINNTHLEKILFNTLFEDPEEISILNCAATPGECEAYLSAPFPIDSDLVSPMYELALKLLYFSPLPKDVENNAKDDTTP